MSGMWKRSMAVILGHSQTKGRANREPNLSLNHRATSRLYRDSSVQPISLRTPRHDIGEVGIEGFRMPRCSQGNVDLIGTSLYVPDDTSYWCNYLW